ncbi:MAG: hypothetical protein HKN47_03900 [Pirellulaceae bacterium]|nr:hypothetical protein [Pirellulaceae bacterium]
MSRLDEKQQLVLIERHLALESELAEQLNDMNQAAATVLSSAGLKGPTEADLETLKPITERVQASTAKVTRSRTLLLSRVNIESDSELKTIRQMIGSLPPHDRARLNVVRREILAKSSQAQANLVHNQAVLFYTFDFHRKYLAGVLQSDVDQQNYAADGQTQDVHPGNIFGKTC